MPRPLVTEGVDFYRFRESHQTKRRESFGKIVEICDQTVETSPRSEILRGAEGAAKALAKSRRGQDE